MTSEPESRALRCESLRKSFGGVHVLTDVNLEFPDSGIIAVIGPNGAGKTTLLNILTGFVRVDSGRVLWGESEITNLSPRRIVRLGIARTFQEVRLIRQVSVLDNVLLARQSQRGEQLLNALLGIGVKREEAGHREKARQLLDFIGLAEKAERPAGELSYGQQKLLSLAGCLATEPRVIFLDEPIAGVHPRMVEHIIDLLNELKAQGKLVVFIEHDIPAIRQCADALIVLDHGHVIAGGAPEEVLSRPEIMEAYLA